MPWLQRTLVEARIRRRKWSTGVTVATFLLSIYFLRWVLAILVAIGVFLTAWSILSSEIYTTESIIKIRRKD